MDLNKKIADLTRDCIDNPHTFLVEVSIKGNPNNQKIQIFIDGDQLVDIDECSRISRKLSDILEERDLIDGRYTMEVSSPGVSNSLKLIRQYPKHIGREFEIVKKDKSKLKGELIDVIKEDIVLSVPIGKSKKDSAHEEQKLNISEIDSARVLVKF